MLAGKEKTKFRKLFGGFVVVDILFLLFKIIFVGFLVFLFGAVFYRGFKSMFAPVKTVDAVVVKKYKVDNFSKYSGTGVKSKYVVVFESGSKLIRLYVSEFSYNQYKVNEKGSLTYKGNSIIDFE